MAYAGQPIDSLVPQLINKAVRKATWEYATLLLAEAGECAECGQDIGRAGLRPRLAPPPEPAGSGRPGHPPPGVQRPRTGRSTLIAVLHADRRGTDPVRLDETDAAEFVTVLAAGIALHSAGGLVLRTTEPGTPDRLHGWRLHHGRLDPLTEGEVFSAYCTDAETGDPLAPEPDVEYRAGFPIDQPDSHH